MARVTLPQLKFVMTTPQRRIFSDPHRFRIVVAGRRFGKTFLSKYELLSAALAKPHSVVWYVAPTYRQAKELMWRPMKEYLPAPYIRKKNETEMSMILVNGSEIKLKGADNPDSLRGSGIDFVVFDEARDQQAYVWDVVRPALADKEGRALWITTPKGLDWVYDLIVKHKGDAAWSYQHYTTEEGGNVSKAELESAKLDMDPRMYKQEFEASFESLSGLVYYAFDLEKNVADLPEAVILANKFSTQLHVGMDFNVAQMYSTVAVLVKQQLQVVETICVVNGNTDLMANEIRRRYPKNPITCYPDPTGRARKTSAEYGKTDFTILQQHQFQVVAPNAPYPMKDRINCTNRALCDAEGNRRVMLHHHNNAPLIKGYMGLTYVQGTNEPDKSLDLEHCLDALGYTICRLFPLSDGLRRIEVSGA